MACPLSQKTYKLEFEYTVAMDEVGEEHINNTDPDLDLESVQKIQQALACDETALTRLMLGAALAKLQEYADYLAAQDSLSPFQELAGRLEAGDDETLPDRARVDFMDLTRPIRSSSLSTRLKRSVIHEQVAGEAGESRWEPVWTDLRPESELGRILERYWVPVAPAPFLPGLKCSHYLLARYLTRQRDGVHAEARCTCETTIEGVGEDESQALDRLWKKYQEHMEWAGTARRIQIGLKNIFSKG